jgi:biopolymer transport protein ExbD
MWGFVSIMLAILLWTWFGQPYPPSSPRSSVDRAIATHSTPQPGALKEDALRLSITRDGRVFFRDHQVRYDDVPQEIREAVRNGAERKVYLVVDARSRYGETIAIVDQIRRAGIESVSLLTEQPYH